MGPAVLSDAIKDLPSSTDPNLIVGFEKSDDAAVYKISDDIAVVSTVDFITPPVDDPLWFGRIAAANSLSDIYAMGGRPLTALNLVMFPSRKLDIQILKGILRGGSEKVAEAGASIAGGHSIDDEEPKYGLAVTGVVSPKRVLTNGGVLDGDVLVLTKPLGTGVLFNACRSKKLPWSDLEPILPQVASLNRLAIETALRFDIHACTDITGFGILGHSLEMALASGLRIDLQFGALPIYPNALEMYSRGETTGSNKPNRALVASSLQIGLALSSHEEEILFDPQTSGGLLLSLPASEADELASALRTAGIASARIVGEAVGRTQPGIRVI
ncbi:MAG: selenide, water dikinase SelD [Desulfobacteraceae bacterium]|nr:selenide, water dikinase SelD [Desulfobacteraceae bacterium]